MLYITIFQWIGWREKLQDIPIFDGQNSMVSGFGFPFNPMNFWNSNTDMVVLQLKMVILQFNLHFSTIFPAFLEPTPPRKPWGQDDLPPTAEVPSTSMASSGNLALHGVLFQRVEVGFHRLVKDTVYKLI